MKHPIEGAAAALIATLVILMMLSTPALADAATIGMEKHSGADWELYIDPYSSVDVQAVIIINYNQTSDLVLHNADVNRTYNSLIIPPRSSLITTLDFPNVETTYSISVLRDGADQHSFTRTRPSFYLPPPNNNWHITPPAKDNPNATYTKQNLLDAIASAIAGVTIQIILIATLVAAFGMCLGAAFKAASKMLVPKDLLSLGVYLLMLFDITGLPFIGHWASFAGDWNRLWYLPFIIGYLVGFMLWHIPYYEAVRLDCAGKCQTVSPQVYYYPEHRASPAIMEQNNIALIKRWLGFHHYVGTDGGINPDWFVSMKKPYWPKVAAPALFIEKEERIATAIKIWKFKAHKYETRLHLSNASLMPKYYWLQSTKAFFGLQEQAQRLAFELTNERLTHKARTTIAASDMIGHSIRISPAENVAAIFEKRQTTAPAITDLGETTLTEVEDTSTEEQEGDKELPEHEKDRVTAEKDERQTPQKGKKKNKKEKEPDTEED